MSYQESLGEAAWYPAQDSGWEGEPFKSGVNPDAPAVQIAPIASGLWNTLKLEYVAAQGTADFERLTAVRRGMIRAALCGMRGIIASDGKPINFVGEKRDRGSDLERPTAAFLDEIEKRMGIGPIQRIVNLIWVHNEPGDLAGN